MEYANIKVNLNLSFFLSYNIYLTTGEDDSTWQSKTDFCLSATLYNCLHRNYLPKESSML